MIKEEKGYRKDEAQRGRDGGFRLRGMALALAAALLLACCGQGGNNSLQEGGTGQSDSLTGSGSEEKQQVMGRYVEYQTDLPEELQYARNLWLDDEGMKMLSADGNLYLSEDQGASWQPVSQAPAELQELLDMGAVIYVQQNGAGEMIAGYLDFPVDEDGNVTYESYTYENVLYLADGSRISINQLPEEEFVFAASCDREGTFYLGGAACVYRVSSQDGSLELLAELSSSCEYLTVCGSYLMIQGEQLLLYDLEAGEMAEQDTVLSTFLEPWLGTLGDGSSSPYLLYQSSADQESLYVLTKQGLYRHTLYGSVMEQVIDGSLCSMSNPSLGFVDMVQNGEIFWVLYSDGLLKRYIYDADIAAVPENALRVWGLYEDSDIQMVISAFNQKYPDLYITYEHPLSEDTGMTRDDAMKVLSTELAAGTGPDVLLLDELPYDTYVEKGVLADLSELLDSTGEQYMENIREAYRRDGGQYAMPMGMELPVLMGVQEEMEGIADLEQLAELLEETRESCPEGSLIGFYRAEEALTLLAAGSMDAWMDGDDGVDSGRIRDFLTQAKRIYEAQISGLSQQEQEIMEMNAVFVNGTVVSRTEAGYQMSNALYFRQPYALGMLNNNLSSMSIYSTVAAMLQMQGMTCMAMPGQASNLCQATGILAVNAASGVKEQAMELVAYALSAELWEKTNMTGGDYQLGCL